LRHVLSNASGCAPEQQSPEALGAHQRAEIEKWWPIIKAAGIKAM
jgi:tripartite-type tricarboxylate transporter receptor subunit TctC